MNNNGPVKNTNAPRKAPPMIGFKIDFFIFLFLNCLYLVRRMSLDFTLNDFIYFLILRTRFAFFVW
jgi:hypothetical protein